MDPSPGRSARHNSIKSNYTTPRRNTFDDHDLGNRLRKLQAGLGSSTLTEHYANKHKKEDYFNDKLR